MRLASATTEVGFIIFQFRVSGDVYLNLRFIPRSLMDSEDEHSQIDPSTTLGNYVGDDWEASLLDRLGGLRSSTLNPNSKPKPYIKTLNLEPKSKP